MAGPTLEWRLMAMLEFVSMLVMYGDESATLCSLQDTLHMTMPVSSTRFLGLSSVRNFP